MKTPRNTTDKTDIQGHGLKKGQHTKLAGKRVVITRTKGDTVWFRKLTVKEHATRLWAVITRKPF